MNCNKLPITTSSPLWLQYLSKSCTEQGESIITGAVLDALHLFAPQPFIKSEFLRVFGIYLWVAEIITLKASMRTAWASKFLNLYEILNSWGVNIARWESGQLTCINRPDGHSRSYRRCCGSQDTPLTLLRLLPAPSAHLQPHLQGEMAAAELGVLWQGCPPLTSPPAPRVLLSLCPCYSSVQPSAFWCPAAFCNIRGGLWPTESLASLKTPWLTPRTIGREFVSLEDSPMAVFFSISGHAHPKLFLMQGITIPIFPGFLQLILLE